MQQICICEHSDASYCAYKDAFVAPRSVVGCGFKLSVSGEAASPRPQQLAAPPLGAPLGSAPAAV